MISIEEVRAMAVEMCPYIGRVIMAMEPVATEHQLPATVAADQDWRLYYNADFWDNLPASKPGLEHPNDTQLAIQEAAVSVCVEACRLIQSHAERLNQLIPEMDCNPAYTQELAVVASTIVSNTLIDPMVPIHISPKIQDLPSSILGRLSSKYPTVEELLRILLENFPPPPLPPQPQSPSDNEQQGDNTQQQAPSPLSTKSWAPDNRKAGSSVDGVPRPWEKPPEESPIHQQPGSAPSRRSIQQRTIRNAAKQILAGTVPGKSPGQFLQTWAQQALLSPDPPQLPSLRSLITSYTQTRAGYDIRRYDGRNRRQQQLSAHNHCQFCLPRDQCMHVNAMIVIDTSGSMNLDSLRQALIYTVGIIEQLELDETSTLWSGNTTPNLLMSHVSLEAVRTLTLRGDGGTNMPRVLVSTVSENRRLRFPEPNLIICLTDGQTSWSFGEHQLPAPLVIGIVPDTDVPVLDYVQAVYSEYSPPVWAHTTVVEV